MYQSETIHLDEPRNHRLFALISLSGFYLACVVLLLPHAGKEAGRSFYEVARTASWQQPGQWLVAWCALKILLVSLGGFNFAAGVSLGLRTIRSGVVFAGVLLLVTVPVGGMALGLYYLLKAVL